MSEELKIIANDDGTFSEYDDTFDITIHCKSEEEKNDVMAKLNAPQPKMVWWIYTGDYITDGMLKCSECGFEHDVSERFSYCPNCGAKMQEVEEQL